MDAGNSSFYFYKVAGGKLYAGPLWDFDISSGNCDIEWKLNFNVNDNRYLFVANNCVWYNKLLEFEEFRNLVSSLLEENIQLIKDTIQSVVDFQLRYTENNYKNFEVWDILNGYVWPNSSDIVGINTFEGQLEYLKNWLLTKLDYMLEVYCPSEVSE